MRSLLQKPTHKAINAFWQINLLFIAISFLSSCAQPELSIVVDQSPGVAVSHGILKLTEALELKKVKYEKVHAIDEAKGDMLIITGLSTGDGFASQMIKNNNRAVPQLPEALAIFKTDWQAKPAWVISGFDDRGLMYALLDLADRIGWETDNESPLNALSEITEKPAVKERAISLYTMNRSYWESRFYDDKYWEKYLDVLAKNRFNSLVLIFGYENGGFLAPCYPYFFNTEGFSDVILTGITPKDQKRNLETLNKLIEMAHKRGIKLSLGIWDHIYRGGIQGAGIPGSELALNKPVDGLVWGLNAENLMSYTKSALAKLIEVVPELDGIQFRMHGESGLKENEQDAFWSEVFQQIKVTAPDMKLVLRAKAMHESVIQSAIDAGVNFSIGTKYWMEQMGLPYHPTHINRKNQFSRRHGYADMLRYPQQYKMLWRLWNGGTNRILLWGDPDYVKRFAESTQLYDGEGFEVNEPLATKMHGQPHDASPNDLLNPQYRYYEYEFERYWYFFKVFGRLAYNPNTSPSVWKNEFDVHFGKEVAPLIEKALNRASQILPRIVASLTHYDSSFPTTRGWVEKQRLGDLPLYADGQGSDIQLFASFDEEAQWLMKDEVSPKIAPSMTSTWLEQTTTEINYLISESEKAIGNNPTKEFTSTITDLKILSNLALYHSRRIPAAVYYRLFEHTQNISALDSAIAYEQNAIEAWKQIVVAAGDVYANDLMMGVRSVDRINATKKWTKKLSGHWKDELVELENGLVNLRQTRKLFETNKAILEVPLYPHNIASSNTNYFSIHHDPITSLEEGKPLKVTIKLKAPTGVKDVFLRFRAVNQHLDYSSEPMSPTADADTYQAIVPANMIDSTFNFMYYIEVFDKAGHGIMFPNFEKQAPYVMVDLPRNIPSGALL